MSSLRVSGMFSGLDTDSIVQALVSAKTVKVDTLEKEQMLLELQQEKWQEVNSKIFDFYNSTLTTMRNSAAYTQTVTQSSDESVLNITSGTASTNGIQTAAVTQLAKAEYLTGAELETAGSGSVSGSTKLSDLSSWGTDGFSDGTFYVKASDTAARVAITIDENTTMDDLTSQLSKAGVTASFDSENGRLFISSNSTGEANSFSFVDENSNPLTDGMDGYALLSGLGLTEESGATIVEGQDAKVLLNGAEFSSSTNAFAVNGLTFTVSGLSEKVGDVYNEVSISTETNYDGIYDSIKNMISEYNELVNELSSLYNSTSSSLMPLTSEEKMSMTDSDIELWETNLKEGLLSGDSTISDVSSSLYSTMLGGVEVNGSTMYLFDFGIAGLGYFNSAENERYAFHIDGDPDNSDTCFNTDKLKSMIVSDPDTVVDFFTQLSQNLWTSLDEKMKSSDFSSIYKVYNDKQMLSDYNDYTTKIADAETELTDYEEYWYSKFTAMEVALSSLSSKESALSSMLSW